MAVYWLTEGLTSTAARISRVALLPYLVFYNAFDPVVGLSNGLVVKYGSELPASREPAVLTGVSDALANLIHRPVLLTIYLQTNGIVAVRRGPAWLNATAAAELSEQSIMLRLLDRSRCCYNAAADSCVYCVRPSALSRVMIHWMAADSLSCQGLLSVRSRSVRDITCRPSCGTHAVTDRLV